MKKLVVILFYFIICSVLQGQDTVSSVDLIDITVTSKKTDLKEHAPAGDKLDKFELEVINTQNIGDAAKFLGGVSVKDYGGLGGVKTVNVRGLSSSHTSVMYDGVNLFDNQSGQIDLSKYSLSNVNSLSLANGQFTPTLPSATSLASGASINIEMKKPDFEDENFKGDLALTYGSFNLFSSDLFLAGRNKNDVFLFSGNLTNTNGRYPYKLYYGASQNYETEVLERNNNDMFSYHAEANWYHSFNQQKDIKLKAYYYYSSRGLPSAVSLYYNNSAERLWNKNFFVQQIYTHYINDKWSYRNKLKADYNYTHYIDPHYFGNPDGEDDEYIQKFAYTSNALSYQPFGNMFFTLTNDLSLNSLNSSAFTEVPDRFSSLTAFIFNFKFSKFYLTANVLHSFYYGKYGKESSFTDKFSPFVSLQYTNGNYRSSLFYKNIFRMPTFNELYYKLSGNKELKPEETDQFCWSNSYDLRIKNIVLVPELDLYYNNVYDKIVAIPRNVFLWSMLNYGKVEIKGADFKLSSYFTFKRKYLKNINIKINYSYQKAIDNSKDSYTYRQILPYMPENVLTSVISFGNDKYLFGYTCMYVSKRYCLSENTEFNLLKPYFEHNTNFTYNINLGKYRLKTLYLTMSINNIFNCQYEVIKSYPMMGRNYNLKIKFDI